MDVRNAVHKATGGWPGRIDRLMRDAIHRADRLPLHHADLEPSEATAAPPKRVLAAVSEPDEHPDMRRLILTLNGKTLRKVRLDETKFLIGRSELCDLYINSRFVSQYHALLIRTDKALHLVDLHSTNGTFVNSRRITSKVLQHEDVLSIGNHGIKLKFPQFRLRSESSGVDLDRTATMRTLQDTGRDTVERQTPTRLSERQV